MLNLYNNVNDTPTDNFSGNSANVDIGNNVNTPEIIVGIIIAFLLIGTLIYIMKRVKKKNQQKKQEQKESEK